MKRRVLVEYEQASPGVRALYDECMGMLGLTDAPNWMKAMGTNENVLRATWEKFRNVVLVGSVPPLLKQLILFVISVKEGNRYCTAAHGHAVLAMDPTLSCEDLYSLARGEAHEGLPSSFRTAIALVTQAALDPDSVDSAQFDFETRLREEGFSEREIDELLAQADFGVMMNAITRIWDIPADKEFPPETRPAAAVSAPNPA